MSRPLRNGTLIQADCTLIHAVFFCSILMKEGHGMDMLEIKKMSRIERLQAMEALWDSLTDEETEIESPRWHRSIFEERKRRIENGESEFISLEKLRASRKPWGCGMSLY